MPTVTILPLGQAVNADEGATVMEAARAHGLYWPTTCGGQGICTSCACSVESGEQNLDAMGPSEARTLVAELGEAAVRRRRLRLACQARVRGDVTVTKHGVRPGDATLLSMD
jgi:2Fe-2S ferredoxin